MSKMPSGLKNGFQLTYHFWHWFYVQKVSLYLYCRRSSLS